MAKVDLCFSSKKITNSYLLLFLRSCCPEKHKKLDDFGAENLTKITINEKKGWRRPRWATIFLGWKYRVCQEKKLKIALLKETVFMVKYRFKGWTIRFTNICGPLTWIKYLQHIRGFNSSPWFLLWFDIVNIMMISLCSLLCDLVLFMGNIEGSFIWILLRYCIRHSASWNLLIIANSISYVVLRT